MSRLFQIYEDDLAELEKALPELSSALMAHQTPRLKVKMRRCKEILSNVRWNYGPPDNVHVIPADGPSPDGDDNAAD